MDEWIRLFHAVMLHGTCHLIDKSMLLPSDALANKASADYPRLSALIWVSRLDSRIRKPVLGRPHHSFWVRTSAKVWTSMVVPNIISSVKRLAVRMRTSTVVRMVCVSREEMGLPSIVYSRFWKDLNADVHPQAILWALKSLRSPSEPLWLGVKGRKVSYGDMCVQCNRLSAVGLCSIKSG